MPNSAIIAIPREVYRRDCQANRAMKTFGKWETGGLWAFGGFLHSIGTLTFSADGHRLVVGSSGAEALRLFELQQFQPLITLAGEGSLFAPQFSPSGDHLAARNAAGNIFRFGRRRRRPRLSPPTKSRSNSTLNGRVCGTN